MMINSYVTLIELFVQNQLCKYTAPSVDNTESSDTIMEQLRKAVHILPGRMLR